MKYVVFVPKKHSFNEPRGKLGVVVCSAECNRGNCNVQLLEDVGLDLIFLISFAMGLSMILKA